MRCWSECDAKQCEAETAESQLYSIGPVAGPLTPPKTALFDPFFGGETTDVLLVLNPVCEHETQQNVTTDHVKSHIVLNVFRSCYLNRWFCKF